MLFWEQGGVLDNGTCLSTKKEEMDLALRSWICLWLPIFQARVERQNAGAHHT